MFHYIHWLLWKRRMKKVSQEQLGTCLLCNDPVYPGDFVGVTTDGKVVHAGFHWTMHDRNAFCETGAVGSATWTSEGTPRKIGPMGAEIAMKTGKSVITEVGSHDVSHTV